jgi:putative hemolysin
MVRSTASGTEQTTPRGTPIDRDSVPPLDEVHAGYRLRFAASDEDRDRIFALRFEVFALELGEALPGAYTTLRDADPFDLQCDHLLVEEVGSGKVVGTYRLQLAEMARAGRGFYSAVEFELAALPLDLLDRAVELGRACIAREHRNKNTLFLLWRGLGAYLLWNDRRSFFGCSSLTSQDPAEGVALYRRLVAERVVSTNYRIVPNAGFECDSEPATKVIELPKLFATYLRHGAEVLGPPAIDREFGTIDFLTLLEVDRMPRRLFDLFTHGLPRRSRSQ